MKRSVIYARVSTVDQTCDNQLRDLREYCRARGWDQVTEYVDEGVSGTTDRRLALDQLMTAVKARRVDVVVVAAFDRFGRSVRHLVGSPWPGRVNRAPDIAPLLRSPDRTTRRRGVSQ